MTPQQNAEITKRVSAWAMHAVEAWQNDTPRSQQVRLGPSDLGGCRELMRAKISGDIATLGRPVPGPKWAAFIGTAVGDYLEAAVKAHGGARTQVDITCRLPRSGIEVTGNADVFGRDEVIDWKGQDGLEEVAQKGSPLKYLVQISAYLVGGVQMGLLTRDAIGTLVYYDRSGKLKRMHTESVTYSEALGWLDKADDNLEDVMKALATGETGEHLRDEPESWCFYTGCPMYQNCWAGYEPTDKITDPKLIDAMEMYDQGREAEKAAKKLQDAAKAKLGIGEETPVSGVSKDWSLNWSFYERAGTVYRRIDLRRRRT